MCESQDICRRKTGLVPKHSLAKPGSTPPHELDGVDENWKRWREEKDDSYKTPGVLGPKDIGLEPGKGTPLAFGKKRVAASKKFLGGRGEGG